MSADADIVEGVLDAQVPGWDQALVIVNSPVRGGAGGRIAVAANGGSDWKEVCVHELGHSLFGLADEYGYWEGCGTGETGRDTHSGLEPDEPNVTINSNRTTIKWAHLIEPATVVPTTVNADCSDCDPQGNPVPGGTVGAFEGAHYAHCGCYRPEFNCIMRQSDFGSFCAVCEEQICTVLAPFTTTITPGAGGVVFHDVPEGVTAPGAAVFTVDSGCATIHLEIVDGPDVLTGPPGTTFGTQFGTTFASSPLINPRPAYVWLTYTGTTDGDAATGTVRVRCVETEEEFDVPITANTVARPSVAVALVLDKSGSMGDPSGIPDRKRIDVLRFSAPPFVDVLPEGNAVGVVSFDQNAYIDMGVQGPTGPIDLPDLTRITARSTISAHVHNPSGATAIGDGLEAAHDLLDPIAGYDVKATIVLTDGHETAAKYIADVAGLINERVYAIGLGTAEQVKPAALTALTNGTGGYTLMTGALGVDQYFRLSKYYLQILAGVRNADVVLDPEGFITSGASHRIPFTLAETDIDSDVILLSPFPGLLDLALETPGGDVIDPASLVPGVAYVEAEQNSYYRVTLPVVVNGAASREGVWHALITVDDRRLKRYLATLEESKEDAHEVMAHGSATASTSTRSPTCGCGRRSPDRQRARRHRACASGADGVRTTGGCPAGVRATITRPDATTTMVVMPEVEPGVFETSFAATVPGVYHVLVQATATPSGEDPSVGSRS